MSGSTEVAIENPSRARIPDEYVLIGASMNSPMSANSTIAGSQLVHRPVRDARGTRPRAGCCRARSGPASKPAPSVSSVETWPATSTAPSVGWMIPASACSSVLLPAPFGPMTASDSPWTSRKDHVPQRPEVGRPARCVGAACRTTAERRLLGEAQVVADAEVADVDRVGSAPTGHRDGRGLAHRTFANAGSSALEEERSRTAGRPGSRSATSAERRRAGGSTPADVRVP